MRDLEKKYPQSLAIVGVHSGKFRAERETDRVRDAALRLGNTHPIINDRQFRVWRGYAVNAWPTLAVVNTEGRVLGMHAGEFTLEQFSPFIDELIAAYTADGTLRTEERHFRPDEPNVAPTTLRYPGKVAVDGDRLAIADSGNNRVIIARISSDDARATTERVAGTGTRGFADGVDGSFDYPQGLAFDGDTLYVADAGNHAIRAVNIATGEISTVAGTGRQLRTRDDQHAGAMSSPWDVTLIGRTLYIAMAGIHQLWSLDLTTRATSVNAGTFREDMEDGPHAKAALAQPMGIASGAERLYFVDSETSAVRWSDIDPAGRVGTIAGTGLFDFGDRDGTGDDVLMQHAQGISRHPDGRLLVADSYNDALKWVDPATRAATTWVRDLHESGGVACGRDAAYVADTNAHRVIRVSYREGEAVEVDLV
ncbi:MAG TPA: alkyl hydroperoxide reductase [Gemmatimonadaceae bacterium]|nr:alkyl hydroperoxide reductase [Gemmatimonadaceae bacterium]